MFISLFIVSSYSIYAEEVPVETTESVAPMVETQTEVPALAVPMSVEAPAAVAAPAVEETLNTDNLEFISGEVTATDEAAKTVTIKLYGETESDTNQKMLTVKVDETTDITDGEKDRDTHSLTAGTEVDVEFDPISSKATYIFVY